MKKTFLLPIIFCTTLLIAILVKLFIIDIVVVSGSSMYPTIKDGDVIFIDNSDNTLQGNDSLGFDFEQ